MTLYGFNAPSNLRSKAKHRLRFSPFETNPSDDFLSEKILSDIAVVRYIWYEFDVSGYMKLRHSMPKRRRCEE